MALPRKDFYRIDELVDYFHVSRRTLYRKIRDKQIRAVPIGRVLRVPLAEVERLERRNDL